MLAQKPTHSVKLRDMSETISLPEPKIAGLIVFCRMASYARMARDVSMTKGFDDQLAMARMGASLVEMIDRVGEYYRENGVQISQDTQAFVGMLDDMEARTRPGDWWERIIKSYVMVGLLADFEDALVADFAFPTGIDFGSAARIGHGDWTVARLAEALAADTTLAPRLSMWARRVAGEVRAAIGRIMPMVCPLEEREALYSALENGYQRRMEKLSLAF